MPRIDIMTKREIEIGKLINYISLKTNGFEKPKLILIGGYALRSYVPFSRYSRDCDFVLREGLSYLRKIKPNNMDLEALEQKEEFGFMRWVKLIELGNRKVKMGVDFMGKQVRGRDGEIFNIDEKFIENSKRTSLNIGIKCSVFVPDYPDIFLLKAMSSRKSDIRDIAAMIWKTSLPENVLERVKEVTDIELIRDKIKKIIIPEIKNKFFLHSFRGTFITEEFNENDKIKIIKELDNLLI